MANGTDLLEAVKDIMETSEFPAQVSNKLIMAAIIRLEKGHDRKFKETNGKVDGITKVLKGEGDKDGIVSEVHRNTDAREKTTKLFLGVGGTLIIERLLHYILGA